MEEEILENQDSSNLDAETGETVDTSNEEAEAELKKAKEYAQNQKIRAEKAEKELKELKSREQEKVVEEAPKEKGLDLKAIRALSDVPDEDVDDVMEYAKFKGISIPEAKKSPVIQTLLKTKAEERKTAEVANITTSRRASSKVSPDVLLEKARDGKLNEDELSRAAEIALEKMYKR